MLLALSAAAADKPTPVILISIDTLRADHLSAYGYKRLQTPNIDAFGQDGTAFTAIESQIPLTLPSHTSLLTSTYPFENGTEENAEPVKTNAATLAAALHEAGYKTGAFIGSVFLEKQLGLDKGFDLYDSPFNAGAFSALSGELIFAGPRQNSYQPRDTRDGALVIRSAAQWLNENRGVPLFAFVHLFDLHKPYSVPDSVAVARGLSRYDTELEYVDQLMGRFLRTLTQMRLWDRALVIVVSDHGEGLDEHGESSHGYFIYQSTVWVPVLFHWPKDAGKMPDRAAQPGGLIDVAPTILDFLHIARPVTFEGHSLLDQEERPVYTESVYAHDAFGWSPLRSIRLGEWKYIEAPKQELYNLRQDPDERHNVWARNLSVAESLRSRLQRLLARYDAKPPTEASGQTGNQAVLNSLGYLSRGPRTGLVSGGADPKDRLADYQLYEKALDEGYAGRTEAAITLLRQIVQRDPHDALATRDLGECYVRIHDYARARQCFAAVLVHSPGDYMSHLGLGIADEHLKMLPEAQRELEAACKIAPESVQCQRELAAVKKLRQ